MRASCLVKLSSAISLLLLTGLLSVVGVFTNLGVAQSEAITTGTIITVAGGGDQPGPTPAVSVSMLPISLAANVSTGNLYVGDYSMDVVRMITPTGTETVVAGDGRQGYSGDGGPAIWAQMVSPSISTVDPAGNLLIADHNRVRMVAATSCSSSCPYALASTVAGDIYTIAGDGIPGYSGDGGPATNAGMSGPGGIAVDSSGNLFLTDVYNNRIRMVAATSCSSSCPYGLASTTAGDIYTIAGDGTQGYSGDGGPAVLAELEGPSGMSVDSSGNLFFPDTNNNRIRMVAATSCSSSCLYGLASTTAGDIYTIAGDGTRGYSGDGGPATIAELGGPFSVTVDSFGNLVIPDIYNNRIRMIARDSCSSSCPYGLASTTAGDIYTIAGDGTQGYSGDGGPATSARLSYPYWVAVGTSGNLFIADFGNNRIRMVAATSCSSSCLYGLASTTAGDIYTIAGDGAQNYFGVGVLAASAEMGNPSGVALDPSGDIFISDTYNNRIRMVAATSCSASCPYGLASTTAGDIYTIAGDGTQGYSGDGGPATSAQLFNPSGIVVDPAGNLLIADTYNERIRMVAAISCLSSCPYGLASTVAGDIYTVAGDGIPGYFNGLATTASLEAPSAVAVDSLGDLFILQLPSVGDSSSNIRMVAAASCSSSCPYALTSTTAGDIYSLGNIPGQIPLSAGIDGIALDSSGNVIFASSWNNLIYLLARTSCPSSCPYGLASTTAGDFYAIAGGGSSVPGDGGPATSAQLDNLAGVTIDPSGNVYVVNPTSNDILMVAGTSCSASCPDGLASTSEGDIYTVAGDGTRGYSGDGGPAASAELNYPTAIATDSSGDLFIADTGNQRIREVVNSASSQSSPTSPPLPPPDVPAYMSAQSQSASTNALVTLQGITANGFGIGALTVAMYPGAPTSTNPATIAPPLSGSFFDVALSPGNSFSQLTLSDCVPMPQGGTIYWYNSQANSGSGSWEPVTPVPISSSTTSNCLETTISKSSSPSLSQLSGTVFLAGTAPRGLVLIASNGQGYGLGGALALGNPPSRLDAPIVGGASTPDGKGYWEVASDGGVFTFGDAGFYGSMGGRPLNAPIVGMAVTPDGKGYWEVGSDGGVFTFGDAGFYGSLGQIQIGAPVVAMAATSDGKGYWLLKSTGTVINAGDARRYGSVYGYNQDYVSFVLTADSNGYWLINSFGEVNAYGDASPLFGFSSPQTIVGAVLAS